MLKKLFPITMGAEDAPPINPIVNIEKFYNIYKAQNDFLPGNIVRYKPQLGRESPNPLIVMSYSPIKSQGLQLGRFEFISSGSFTSTVNTDRGIRCFKDETWVDPQLFEIIPVTEEAKLLSECRNSLLTTHEFKVGQYVRWKPHLRTNRYIGADQPCVVIKIYPPQTEVDVEISKDVRVYKSDMEIGYVTEDNKWESTTCESRRMMPV